MKDTENQLEILDKSGQPLGVQKKHPKRKRKKVIKQILFGLIWLYSIVRILFIDVDLILVTRYFNVGVGTYAIFRFLLIVLVILTLWLFIGNKRFWKNLGLLVLFPFYPVSTGLSITFLWTLPKFMLKKNWLSLLYNYFDSIVGFFVHFKLKLINLILFTLGLIFLFSFDGRIVLISIPIFAFLLIMHLIKRWKQAFQPFKILHVKIGFDAKIDKQKLQDSLDGSTEKIKNEDEEKQLMNQMEGVLMLSEIVTAFNMKVKDVLNNRLYLKSFIWRALISYIVTIILFGGINFALFKWNADNFRFDFLPTYFDFFYYSFFSIILDGSDIVPISHVAKAVKMVAGITGLFIGLLILAVYFVVSNDKYKENLEKLIKFSEEYSNEIRKYFKSKFGFEPKVGIEKLRTNESEMVAIIDFFNKTWQKKK